MKARNHHLYDLSVIVDKGRYGWEIWLSIDGHEHRVDICDTRKEATRLADDLVLCMRTITPTVQGTP